MSLAQRQLKELQTAGIGHASSMPLVSSDEEYFPSQFMNQTFKLVREKLSKIQSSSEHTTSGSSKKIEPDETGARASFNAYVITSTHHGYRRGPKKVSVELPYKQLS